MLSNKARAAVRASLEALFVRIKSITVRLVVVKKASLLKVNTCGSTSKLFVGYSCLLSKASSYSM